MPRLPNLIGSANRSLYTSPTDPPVSAGINLEVITIFNTFKREEIPGMVCRKYIVEQYYDIIMYCDIEVSR